MQAGTRPAHLWPRSRRPRCRRRRRRLGLRRPPPSRAPCGWRRLSWRLLPRRRCSQPQPSRWCRGHAQRPTPAAAAAAAAELSGCRCRRLASPLLMPQWPAHRCQSAAVAARWAGRGRRTERGLDLQAAGSWVGSWQRACRHTNNRQNEQGADMQPERPAVATANRSA